MACKDDDGYVTQLKQQKSKSDITYRHIISESMCWQVISPFWFLLF